MIFKWCLCRNRKLKLNLMRRKKVIRETENVCDNLVEITIKYVEDGLKLSETCLNVNKNLLTLYEYRFLIENAISSLELNKHKEETIKKVLDISYDWLAIEYSYHLMRKVGVLLDTEYIRREHLKKQIQQIHKIAEDIVRKKI